MFTFHVAARVQLLISVVVYLQPYLHNKDHYLKS